MTGPGLLEQGAALLGAGGLGAAALKLAQFWLERRGQAPSKAKDAADLVSAAAVFQQHLNVAAEGIVAQLRDQIEEQGREIDRLRQLHERCELDAQNLRGDLNEQRQQFESLGRWLAAQGIPMPDLTGQRPLIVIEAKQT